MKAACIALRAVARPYQSGLNPWAMSKAATSFYAVCRGRKVGVFTSWCVSLVMSRPAFGSDLLGSAPAIVARYKAFQESG